MKFVTTDKSALIQTQAITPESTWHSISLNSISLCSKYEARDSCSSPLHWEDICVGALICLPKEEKQRASTSSPACNAKTQEKDSTRIRFPEPHARRQETQHNNCNRPPSVSEYQSRRKESIWFQVCSRLIEVDALNRSSDSSLSWKTRLKLDTDFPVQ